MNNCEIFMNYLKEKKHYFNGPFDEGNGEQSITWCTTLGENDDWLLELKCIFGAEDTYSIDLSLTGYFSFENIESDLDLKNYLLEQINNFNEQSHYAKFVYIEEQVAIVASMFAEDGFLEPEGLWLMTQDLCQASIKAYPILAYIKKRQINK